MAAVGKVFDYAVPPEWADRVRVGTAVRINLHGRRVGGWVVELADEPATDRPVRPLARVSGWGPPPSVVDLARWAAWRWAGRPAHFLLTGSPARVVAWLPPPSPSRGLSPAGPGEPAGLSPPGPAPATALPAVPSAAGSGGSVGWSQAGPGGATGLADDALARPVVVVRLPPAADRFGLVADAAKRGDALVLSPSLAEAAILAAELRQAGFPVALLPGEWARARAGGHVAVGSRAAAWAPMERIDAVVVLDEHDEAYQQEQAPTWNARDVALERARRVGAPCVLVSPCPSLEALAAGSLVAPARAEERAGWPVVEAIDRRQEPPSAGLYSPRLVAALRQAEAGARVVCVLNRRGHARLLACATCGELARCDSCDGPMARGEDQARLACQRCGRERPAVCGACGAARLKVLRVGVSRAREELELLAGRPVAEVTGDLPTGPLPGAAVLVGTEAVLHRVAGARVVAFLDFDQELLALRYRAAEEAFGLLARAARVVGGRDRGGRVLVQTRLPGHEAIDAAVHADPGRLSVVELARRVALRFPPEAALARVSGPVAAAYVAGLAEAAPELEVSGPAGPAADRWLLRAADHRVLCDALAEADRHRPKGRLRVEVDPLRA